MIPSYNVKDTKFDIIILAENILIETISVANNEKHIPTNMFQFYGQPLIEDARNLLSNVRIANEMDLNDEEENKYRKQYQLEAKASFLKLYSDILVNIKVYPKSEYIYKNILTNLYDFNKKLKNWMKSDLKRKIEN